MDRGEEFYVRRNQLQPELPPELPLAARPAFLYSGEAVLRIPTKESGDAEAFARIDHGRWVVDCPFCPSAQMAFEEDHRFLCADCLNADASGAWVRVIWPKPAVRKAIEGPLVVRPKANQNWRPGESPAELRAENQARGYPEG